MGGTHGVRGTDNDIYARFGTNPLTMDDSGSTTASDFLAYERARANLAVNTETASLGTGRKGVVRVGGFHNSPLYAEINLTGTSVENPTIEGCVLPADGSRTFTFEILDESYAVLHQKDELLTIQAGASAPDSGDDDASGG